MPSRKRQRVVGRHRAVEPLMTRLRHWGFRCVAAALHLAVAIDAAQSAIGLVIAAR